jgi:hypothetical protein
MADALTVYTASALVDTGKGQLEGIVISTTTAGATATFYDNTAGSGTRIFEVNVSIGNPAIIFFSERFCIKYVTGLYLTLAANMSAVVWSRQL